MQDRKDVTVPMPGQWAEQIESELEYGDSMAGWVREAVRQRFEAEGIEYVPLDQAGNERGAMVTAD